LYDNNVIATTTALAYPRDNANKPDVCIVRLLISQYVPVDVNLDLVVNVTDFNLVADSPYYDFILDRPSKCPMFNGHRQCGRADVNNDGFVNQLDQTAITQSVQVPPGMSLPCGGVYASAFSCGSTRSAPLTPAIDISLDSIVYFDNDGENGVESPLRKRESGGTAESIMVQFEHMRSDVMAAVRSEVGVVCAELGSKVDQHDQILRRSPPATQHEMLVGGSVAAAVVVLSGIMVYFIAKRR